MRLDDLPTDSSRTLALGAAMQMLDAPVSIEFVSSQYWRPCIWSSWSSDTTLNGDSGGDMGEFNGQFNGVNVDYSMDSINETYAVHAMQCTAAVTAAIKEKDCNQFNPSWQSTRWASHPWKIQRLYYKYLVTIFLQTRNSGFFISRRHRILSSCLPGGIKCYRHALNDIETR